MTKKSSTLKNAAFYLTYTLLFLCMIYGIFHYFPDNGRILLNHADAWRQHMKAVAYYSKWLRGIFYNIFVRHSLEPETFSFGMGYGSDLYTTLQYYAIGDILNIPAAFVKTEYIYIYFQVITVLRAYLSGITFSLFVRYIRPNARPVPVLAGIFTYIFGSYYLFLGIWHPFFANPMIYFPFLLLGAEKILRENKPGIFSAAVFLAATNNFYFFFTMAVLCVIYVVIRFVIAFSGQKEVTFFHMAGRFLISGTIGVMMSMVTLLPIILALPNNPRSGSGIRVPVFYNREYYKELFRNLISFVYHGQFDVQLGFTGVFAAAVFMVVVKFLLSKGKKYRSEFVILILLTLFLCVPFYGYIFAGGSYVINRWCFACALFAGLIVTELSEELFVFEKRECSFLIALSVLFAISHLILKNNENENIRLQLGILFVCVLTIIITAIWSNKAENGKRHGMTKSCLETVLLLSVIAGNLINAYEAYSPERGNMISDYMEKVSTEEMYLQLQSTETQVVEEAAAQDGLDINSDFYRYSGEDLVWNASLLDGISSTQFLWSLTDSNVSDFFMSVANNDEQNFAYYGLDHRAILNGLCGVDYFSLRFNTPEERALVPAGYAEVYDKYNFAIFKNGNALPLGYMSGQAIARSEYDGLSPVQRQEALLYGTVLEDSNENLHKVGVAEPVFTSEKIEYALEPGEGIELIENGVNAKQGGIVTLNFEGLTGSETYLLFKNLHVDSDKEVPAIIVRSVLSDGTEIENSLNYKTENSQYYSGWHDFIVNMGSGAESKNMMTIQFTEDGTYTWDEMGVYCQPMEHVADRLSEIGKEAMGDVDLHKNPISHASNEISGKISASEDGLLCINLPYSKGFSCYVDGVKTKISKANVMFMAVPVNAGEHLVELKYHTPGLVPGILLSVGGWIIFIFSISIKKKNF